MHYVNSAVNDSLTCTHNLYKMLHVQQSHYIFQKKVQAACANSVLSTTVEADIKCTFLYPKGIMIKDKTVETAAKQNSCDLALHVRLRVLHPHIVYHRFV